MQQPSDMLRTARNVPGLSARSSHCPDESQDRDPQFLKGVGDPQAGLETPIGSVPAVCADTEPDPSAV